MTSEDRKRAIYAQPSAMKEVYAPDGHFVNGHIILRGPDAWHLFYQPMMREPFVSDRPPPNAMNHATSDDLLTWDLHGVALASGGPGSCDELEIGDASIIEHEGRWYMVYGCRPAPPGSRWFALAVSDDLWTWEKVPGDGSPIFIPGRELSGWREEGVMEIKDPSIIRYEDRFLMYYVGQRLVEPVLDAQNQVHTSINLATSVDLMTWEDQGPLISDQWITNPLHGPWGFETPKIFKRDGKFYLFVMYLSGMQYAIGTDPYNFGPWRTLGPWHASVVVNDRHRWYITHSFRPFGKPATLGRRAGPFKGLYLGGLEWSNDLPVPVDLADVMEDWPQDRDRTFQLPSEKKNTGR